MARSFGEIYPEIEQYLKGKSVVAHNAQFEISCLGQILVKCGIPTPPIRWYCTRKIYNLSLADACKRYGISYTPHDALSDAEACAQLMIKDILR
jgi:DNA polymerase-3 subunit epsilon